MPLNTAVDKHRPGAIDTRDPLRNLRAINYTSDLALDFVTTCLKVETAGTITVDMVDEGTAVTLALGIGYHPLRITKVYSSGSATLTGFYGW